MGSARNNRIMVKYLIVFLSVVSLGLQAQTFQEPAKVEGTMDYVFVELDIIPTCVQFRITSPENYQLENLGPMVEMPVTTIKDETSYLVLGDDFTLRYGGNWFVLYYQGQLYCYGREK